MLASSIPTKIVLPFANNAGGSYINVVPVPSQIGVTNGAASFYDGFPPNCFVALAAGGAGPFGKDFNGLLNVMSAWERWYCAGGPITYDSTFQGTSQVGGYPSGAIVQSATTFGLIWISVVDNNTTNPDTGGAGWVSFLALGGIQTGCQLKYVSSSSLLLAPYNGGFLWINGVNQPIQANLNLSNSGLSASTLYYIYAYMSGSTMTLEASATGYTIAANGIPQKTSDVTRTLVGMAYTNGSSQFQAAPLILSYFNRHNVTTATTAVGETWTSGSLIEIPSYPRSSFLSWGTESVIAQCGGQRFNSSSGLNGSDILTIYIDSATAGSSGGGYVSGEPAQSGNFFTSYAGLLSEGLHYATLFGAATGGTTGTISSCTVQVTVRG